MQALNIHSDHQFQTGQNEYWLQFTATETEINIILEQAYSSPQATIDEINLYGYQEIIAYEVYNIYAKSWAKGIYAFSNADSTTLDYIAHQKARLGGRAVFMARYMLGISVFEANNSVVRKAETESILTKNEEKVVVYPNPADNQITFEFNNVEIGSELNIYNSLGRLVLSKQLTDKKTNINTLELSSGIYLYRIKTNNTTETGKFIIY